MAKERIVRLVLFTNIESMGGWVAILQVRGTFNHKTMDHESYPGACQSTVSGSAKEGEDLTSVLFRRIGEELGGTIHDFVSSNLPDKLKRLTYVDNPEKEIATYGMIIPKEMVANIKLGPSSGGLRMVPIVNFSKISDLEDYDNVAGVSHNNTVAMFKDEEEGMKAGFTLLVLPQLPTKQ